MTLVDTSVWVTAKRGQGQKDGKGVSNGALVAELRNLVVGDQALGHDLIYLEMLLGAGGNSRRQLLDDYRRLQMLDTLPDADVVKFCRDHRLENRGIGAVDAHILAATHAAGATVWTLDRAMEKVASTLRLAFVPTLGNRRG